MPTKQYIKKINGYYVKDEDARNSAAANAEAITAVGDRVTAEEKFPDASITLNRIFRSINKRNYSGMTNYDSTKSGAAGLQGGAISGENKMLLAYWNGQDQNLNDNRIVEVNIATGEILKEVTVTYGWCNGLAYDEDRGLVYIVPRGTTTNDQSTNSKEFIILNYSDLSLNRRITLSTDETIEAVCYKEGKLFVLAEGAKEIYRLDPESLAIQETIELEYDSKLYYQNFTYANGKFYVIGSRTRQMSVFNADGSIMRYYDVPNDIDGIHATGELQFIDYSGENNFVIGSNFGAATYDITQISAIDFTKAGVRSYRAASDNDNAVIDIHVDQSATGINPDGSEENPFKEMTEALLLANNNSATRIYVKPGNYEYVMAQGRNNCRIYKSGSGSVVLSGVKLQYCTNMLFNGINIVDSILSENKESLLLTESSVTIQECNISSTNATDGYAVGIAQTSKLNVSNGNTISSAIGRPDIRVNSDSILISSDKYTHVIYKEGGAAKILGTGVSLFPDGLNHYLGSYSYSAAVAAAFNRNRFSHVEIEYDFMGISGKIAKFAMAQQVCVSESYADGSGNTSLAKVYVSLNSDAAVLNGNANVKINNTDGAASIVRTALDDDANGSQHFIKIKNIRFCEG